MKTISVAELANNRGDYHVLDVRESEEHGLACLAGTINIPLGELAGRSSELPTDRPVAILCHHGIRSAHAAAYLSSIGYDTVNIEGGIEQWSVTIDSAVPRY